MSLLSPFQIDLRTLALSVIYINLGRAAPNFPTTSRAHPSYWVYVDLIPPGGLLSPDHRTYFPNRVRWDIWKCVVAGFFQDAAGLIKIHGETQVALSVESIPEPSQLLLIEINSSGVLSEVQTLRNQVNLDYICRQDIEPLILKVESLLLTGMIDCGFVPSGTTTEGLVLPPTPPGEPIVPPGTNDGSPFPRFDEDC